MAPPTTDANTEAVGDVVTVMLMVLPGELIMTLTLVPLNGVSLYTLTSLGYLAQF
jgi:ABC-type microcin C transport system permease subunit YejE